MTTRDWMDQGTALFLKTLDGLGDADFDAPSALPGWTRKHLVAHVHYNAEALRRLVSWAATGVESRMYAGPEQRGAEIEAGAELPAGRLRELVHGSAAALAADLDALPDEAWRSPVVTALGRTVPVSETPWMRTREVSIHAVDLAAGTSFADLAQDVNAAIAADALATHAGRGHAADLAAWLTGRAPEAPSVGSWI
ncbi:maleylpyruvate isomerase [Actinocorallia herbida]|uniref:Maleylpyruvate isomerase n=1 Tax=Actinocorallia herbida TaxID=58109 RepID=A0A3N1CSL0_9ACTN|nr:maleylpyruvate isomerase N-terminal domain-containing protein [Actinocorallia herbida]ROO84299.1 maleylpyruvate isomerase [Actinocorallia herbida]